MTSVAPQRVLHLKSIAPPRGSTGRRLALPWWRRAGGRGGVCRFVVLLSLLVLLFSGNPCSAQSPVNLFTNTVPATIAVSDTSPITLGVKFWSSQAGTISAIRFYRGAKSRNGYVATFYTADGKTKLGSVTMKRESGRVPGWQQAVFATPISINANTTYVAAYYAPDGRYASTQFGLAQTVTSGTLSAPAASTVGGNGVYKTGTSFPTTGSAGQDSTNFFVDVSFTPTGSAPFFTIVLTPANPTIPANTSLGSVVAAIAAKWSDGSPFTGTFSFGAPNSNGGGVYAIDSKNNLIINPSGPGVGAAGGTMQNVTIVATQ